jgi:hypothetical protein
MLSRSVLLNSLVLFKETLSREVVIVFASIEITSTGRLSLTEIWYDNTFKKAHALTVQYVAFPVALCIGMVVRKVIR